MGSDIAMMDMDSGKYFVLHEVAAFIWEKLAQPVSVSDLCAALMKHYDVSADQCAADVLPFVQNAHDKGLVRLVE
jgi:hypothetical protein